MPRQPTPEDGVIVRASNGDRYHIDEIQALVDRNKELEERVEELLMEIKVMGEWL